MLWNQCPRSLEYAGVGDMNETTKSLVQFELKNRFYYLFIEWPDNPVPPNMWRDREEELHFMSDMGLDHLKASIRLGKLCTGSCASMI
jgi:hypothetical protein